MLVQVNQSCLFMNILTNNDKHDFWTINILIRMFSQVYLDHKILLNKKISIKNIYCTSSNKALPNTYRQWNY